MSVKRYSFSPVAVVTQRGANGYFVQCELGVTEYPLGNAGDYVLSTDFDAVVKERLIASLRVKEQRDAFCAGAGWAAASVAMEEWRGTIPEPVTDVASRRYPEVEVKP